MMEVEFRVTWVYILLGLTLFITGCAKKGEEEALITVSPESAVLTLGDTMQFSVDPADITVTWSVNGIQGGDATVGTIDSNGLYTSPSDSTGATEKVIIRAAGPSGPPGAAIAFLTTFEANKRVSTHYEEGAARANTYSSGQKSIAVYKDGIGNINVYTVWADNSQGLSRIWFAKSGDGGNNFDPPVPVEGFIFGIQLSPSLTVDPNGNVFIVWEDYGEGDADILIRKYDGTSFDTPKKVNLDAVEFVEYDSSPSIAVDSSGDLYVVWEYRSNSFEKYPDIYFARSSNQGQTFSRAVIATEGRRPSIAVDSSGIAYAVWEDLDNFPLISPTHIKISRITGTTPGTPQQVDTALSSNYNARFPSVSVGPGGNVYVVWERGLILNPGFSGEIISTYYIDLAIIDAATLSVIDSSLAFPDNPNAGLFGGPAYPTITADNTNIYVAWDDFRNGTKDIYFAKSTDDINFTTNRIVNDFTGSWHEKPSIAVSDEKAYVIWTDYRNTSLLTTISPNDVFFAREE